MSKVFNMVSGGGKNISSIVITGLKSTDTVTCTKDGKSYSATWDDTAQNWEIIGLPLGTFTVTATNGNKTTTETVLIDIAGVYEIEMLYGLWLYKKGDECEYVTGGWSSPSIVTADGSLNTYRFDCKNSYGTITRTKNADNLYLKSALTSSLYEGIVAASFWTENGIDFTDFSTINIKANVISQSVSIRIYTVSPLKQTVTVQSTENLAANFNVNNSGEQEVSFDISNLTGVFYVGIIEADYEKAIKTKEAKIYKISLEYGG